MFYYNSITQASSWELPDATDQTKEAPDVSVPSESAASTADAMCRLVITSPLVDNAVTMDVHKHDTFGSIAEAYSDQVGVVLAGKQLALVWNMSVLPKDMCLSDTEILTGSDSETVQILALGTENSGLPVYGQATPADPLEQAPMSAINSEEVLPPGWHYENHPDGGYYW